MDIEGADTPPVATNSRRRFSFQRDPHNSDSESSSTSDASNHPDRSTVRRSTQTAHATHASENVSEHEPVNPPPKSILKVTDDLVLRLSNEFTPLLQTGWDSLVYIGSPARFRNQTQIEYDHIRKHFEQPLRIRSSTLKVLGSCKFDRLLRPNACIRAEKKLKKLGVIQKIDLAERDEVKYHIDLRPPSEDDEAVILLTDLTCPSGVLHWHRARSKYDLPRTSVLGTDEFDTISNPYHVSPLIITQLALVTTAKLKESDAETKLEKSRQKAKSAKQLEEIDEFIAPEYLPMRHHSAIERLLQAIAGNDPKLDSAPKVWTYFAIAKYFECANTNIVNKWIYNWIYASQNVNFIQNNPEVAYRIGMGIEASDLVQDAFSILVGEKALLRVCAEWHHTPEQPTCSTHERIFEFLDDDDQNRVDHAASSLVHRIRKMFGSISLEMQWLENSEEYSKLKKLELKDEDDLQIIQSFKSLLQEFVRGKMYAVLCKEIAKPFTDLDQFAVDVKVLRQGKFPRFTAIYNQLNQPMRLFTRTYWMALQRVQFSYGNNISCGEVEELKGGQRLLEPMIQAWEVDPENGISVVGRDSLALAASEVSGLFKIQAKTQRDNSFSNVGFVNPESLNLPMQSPKRTSERSETEPSSSGKRRRTNDTTEMPLRPASIKTELQDTSTVAHPKKSPVWHWQSTGSRIPSLSDYESGTISSRDLDNEDLLFLNKKSGETVGNKSGNEASATDKSSDFIFPMELSSPATNSSHGNQRNKLVVGAEDGNAVATISPRWEPISSLQSEEDNLESPTRKSKGFTAVTISQQDALPPNSVESAPGTKGYMESFDTESGLPVFRLTQSAHPSTAGNSEDPPGILLDLQDCVPPSFDPEQRLSPKVDPWDQQWPLSLPRSRNQITADTLNKYTPKKSIKLFDDDIDFFNVDKLLRELSQILSKKCEEIIYPPHLFHANTRVPIDLVDTLTCLDDEEWKYLPLWAGGCDDGTGGVFEEIDVPNLESGGFRGGKRGYRSRSFDRSFADSSVSGTETDSSFDDIASDAISTVGKASKLATDGTETVKSLGSSTESESGFMNQDEIYDSIREMKIEEARKGKAKATMNMDPNQGYGTFENLAMRYVNDNDNDDDGDQSTVMGAGSDIQGDMFHDIDDDEDDNEKGKQDDAFDDLDDEDDDDMEIIEKDDL